MKTSLTTGYSRETKKSKKRKLDKTTLRASWRWSRDSDNSIKLCLIMHSKQDLNNRTKVDTLKINSST